MSAPVWHTIHIHPAAPPKPALGAPCNGCGQCCLVEPCPLGMVVSGKRSGACSALRWSDAAGRYVCGLVADPAGGNAGLYMDIARKVAVAIAGKGKDFSGVFPSITVSSDT